MKRGLLIGAGGIARQHAAAVAAHSSRAQLVAVVDPSPERAAAFAAEFGVPAAFSDLSAALVIQPDFALICAPPAVHAELCLACLRAGAAVLCEKPLCASLAQLDAIQAAEIETGIPCAVVAQRRFGSAGQHIKRLLDAGAFGVPRAAVALTLWHRDHAYYQTAAWRGTWAGETGGMTAHLGVHLLDFALWLLGGWAHAHAYMSVLDRAIEVDNLGAGLVRLENGGILTVVNSALSPQQETRLRLDCQRATIETTHLYDYTNDDWRITPTPDVPPAEAAAWRAIEGSRPATIGTQIEDFITALERGERPAVTTADARRTLELVTALYQSALTGESIAKTALTPGNTFYHALNGGMSLK